jgi:hypothetical protein
MVAHRCLPFYRSEILQFQGAWDTAFEEAQRATSVSRREFSTTRLWEGATDGEVTGSEASGWPRSRTEIAG